MPTPYRTEDPQGVKDFARGCMRTYLILKEKANMWNSDSEIQALLEEVGAPGDANDNSETRLAKSVGRKFDRISLVNRRLPYERLDQLTMEILL